MLIATSLMSLSSLRDFMLGVDLASVIAAEQRAHITLKAAKIDVDPAEDLAEIYALLARFRADQLSASQRVNGTVRSNITNGAVARYSD